MEKKKMRMENLVRKLFRKKLFNKKILIFGNTGFVGSWLSLTLTFFGAKILGISTKMANPLYLSNTSQFKKNIKTLNCDLIRLNKVKVDIIKFKPDIVIHLASQPIVKVGFLNPYKTYETNIIGTLKIFEILRAIPTIKKILVFTSDKVYRNSEKKILIETSAMGGGQDPYSASKSSQDIISQSYGYSFFNKTKMIIIRSGNIIGGGDWAKDRLIPDIIRSYSNNKIFKVRSLNSTRPWIHILDVINAILLALTENGTKNNSNLIFNLSSKKIAQVSVKKIIKLIKKNTIIKKIKIHKIKNKIKEKKYLHISSRKAFKILNWKPKLTLNDSLKLTVKYYLLKKNKTYKEAINQISEFFSLP
jgi:CDP-glucose 4,6-dehydratase